MKPNIVHRLHGRIKSGEVLQERNGRYAVILDGPFGQIIHKRFNDELAARMCLEHAVHSPY